MVMVVKVVVVIAEVMDADAGTAAVIRLLLPLHVIATM